MNEWVLSTLYRLQDTVYFYCSYWIVHFFFLFLLTLIKRRDIENPFLERSLPAAFLYEHLHALVANLFLQACLIAQPNRFTHFPSTSSSAVFTSYLDSEIQICTLKRTLLSFYFNVCPCACRTCGSKGPHSQRRTNFLASCAGLKSSRSPRWVRKALVPSRPSNQMRLRSFALKQSIWLDHLS